MKEGRRSYFGEYLQEKVHKIEKLTILDVQHRGGLLMILEAVMLSVKQGMEQDYEAAFRNASKIISSMKGYISHDLQRCLEVNGKYLLLVNWETLEDHTIGFRQSTEYMEWKKLLHNFYEPFPIVEHFQKVELCHFQMGKIYE